MSRSYVIILKSIIAFGLLLGMGSIWAFWMLSGEMAAEYPEYAFLRWPYLLVCWAIVCCLELILVSIWALLRRVEHHVIFDRHATRWVTALIWAGGAISILLVCAIVPDITITHGPPGLTIMLIIGTAASIGFTLLMIVMRGLLVQATGLKSELDEVI
ncbi:MAG: DUF2975 domain-containing protein [Ancrocorticia sp.]|nr:DUF2975 domain-containing protein [Ancrocorticia sp.]